MANHEERGMKKVAANLHFGVHYPFKSIFQQAERRLCTVLGVNVIKLLIHWKSKVRDYCSFLGHLITVTYKVLALHTVNNFNSSKVNIEFEI